MDPGGRRRRRGAGRGRRARRDPEEARDPAHLPGRRAPALPARALRPRAAPVHRHLQRRGAPVQPRPAPLDLRLLEAGEQLLRLRHRQRRREPRGLPDHQAPHVRRPGAGHARPRRRGRRAARRQGARRAPRPRAGLPSRLGRQHLRDELRRAVAATRSRRSTRAPRWPAACTTPARAGSRRTTATAATWSSRSGRRTSAAATRTAASTSPGSRTSSPAAPVRAHRDQALPGRQARARRDAARPPRSPRRSPRSAASRRASDCASPSRHSAFTDVDSMLDFVELLAAETGLPVGIKSRRRATWTSGTSWSPRWPGAQRGVDFVNDRRRRGRHRRGADDLRRRGRLPVPDRASARSTGASPRPGSPTT